MQLSQNFALSELTVSQTAARHGLNNQPTPAVQANLQRLVNQVLQPLREKVGQPIVVSSGYRSPAVNKAVGGSTSSAHMYGRAADIHVPGMSVKALVKHIKQAGLPVDQVIDEFGQWVHVGIADAGKAPRNQYLQARSWGGKTVYSQLEV